MYNLQGDVVGLADAATGKIIAKYLYDACENVLYSIGETLYNLLFCSSNSQIKKAPQSNQEVKIHAIGA